ncbi:NHLP bacteriocin export ABC transporter permease/ATPase subunit [Pollutimonas thiosulfatoxidans]|uniref:Cyclolysin secretion/processing ATP-binding protein CyaB n=1 Tax=Pollutimonas thiosulfatoxidans TaxID=2028345 RepID=A0A410G9U4_9BURK|nr:NHLP bacteriocin export ABC transporter permease/ATPase subunit [Pollutimonas thiosulfatoxidans]QAA92975.1 NHLP bacteriocin export ABC transporter permease/ATPase subunit [Pollutimonas thiosulfatoxidans]
MGLSSTDPLAGPALHALVQAEGRRLTVAGNTPFLLNDTATVWWLQQGRIELFLVDIREGEAGGARRYFASVEPGTLLFGLDASAPEYENMGLLAVPHVNTEVVGLSMGAVHGLAASGEAGLDLAAPIDEWIALISQGLVGWIGAGPVVHQSLRLGEVALVDAHRRASSATGVQWVGLPGASALYFDTQELPRHEAQCWLPLTPASWVLIGEALEVQPLSTAQLITQGDIWRGLNVLHQLMPPLAGMNVRLANVDEHNRLRSRAASAEREWQQGMGQLRAVLDKGDGASRGVASRNQALVQVLEVIGEREGFMVSVPSSGRQAGDDNAPPSLSAIVRSSKLRQRRVLLRPDWHKVDTHAMLGYALDDGRPLAILPQSGKPPVVYDPASGITVTGRDALAMLDIEAVSFTAPLPPHSIDWRSLGRFTLSRGWRDLLVLLLSTLCGGLLGMAVPVASGYLIDTVIPGHDRNHLVQVGIIVAVLGVSGFVMSYVGVIAFNRFEGKAGSALQAAIIDRLLRLPAGFFRDFTAGDLALRASAITHVMRLLTGTAASAIMGAMFAVFSFTLMLWYDWRMGLWAGLATLIYAGATVVLIVLQLSFERQLAQRSGELQSMMLQFISGIAKLRQSASEDRAFTRWARRFSSAERIRASASSYQNIQIALNAFFGLAALFLFFMLLGKFRETDEVSMLGVGAFAAFLAAFNNFRGSITQLTQTLGSLLAVPPLLSRAMPILQAMPEVSDDKADPGLLSGAVEFSHVSFRYHPDGPWVVDDVSIAARSGEFIAIVGGSGSGKSTLIRLLLGFEAQESGAIMLDGKGMNDLDVQAVRRQMGVVLQNSSPMPGSILENIVGITNGTQEEAWQAARKVGLAEDIEAMPMGMHTMVTEGAGSLSGGQMQRLMIARAIVGDPRILVLDEATSALDNRTQSVVTESLDRLSVTRIVVAHRLSTVTRANRIYVMDAGCVVEVGNYDELMRKNGHFVRLSAAQLV